MGSKDATPGLAPKPQQTMLSFFITLLIFVVVGYFALFPPTRTLSRFRSRLEGMLLRIPLPSYLGPPSDLAIAVRSFSDYHHAQSQALNPRWRSYERLPRKQRALGDKLGWKNKLHKVEEAVSVNARICELLGVLGMDEARRTGEVLGFRSRFSRQDGRVIEVLKHFVRDWSEEGKSERDALFPPILDALTTEFGGRIKSGEKPRVLVPGSGLARLAYETALSGFHATANDYSHFMNIGASLIFKATTRTNEHIVHPYLHTFSHHRSTDSMIRGARFPDVVPSRDADLEFKSGDFLRLFPEPSSFDAITTLFFIDTASNIVSYLEMIWRLLKPGGLWINEGPCLWYGTPRMALAMDDIVRLAELIGFVIEDRKTIKEARYTSDTEGMYMFAYDCEFWIARKPTAVGTRTS
ncbi:BQ5605_C008g05176 [Microbotryum silenes-dioicae]|uniref:BQ5605_C008g05176 protein n=1 Tax=Microbotryum silenes-dioicae TaxID=796604 RepID=A0A2X0MC86_9BASI|nr:BQ5605_C008g05176 [Microbotryum silenes-dioicae]